MRLVIKCEMRSEGDYVRLSGNVVAGSGAELAKTLASAGPRCTFNWASVTTTSSEGIREWVHFLDAFGVQREIRFEECPTSIVMSFLFIPRMLGAAHVVSVSETFSCQSCQRERRELVRVVEDLDASGRLLCSPECERCGVPMAPTAVSEDVYAFLKER